MARTSSDKQSPEPAELRRRNRAGAIAPDVGSAAATAFAKAGFTDPALVLRWAEIVGPEVARLTQPLKFSQSHLGATLTLRAAPGAALFLAHEKRSLAERINAYLGRAAITQIKFVQGAQAARLILKTAEKKPGPLPTADPSRAWHGPDGLKIALQALARRRNQLS